MNFSVLGIFVAIAASSVAETEPENVYREEREARLPYGIQKSSSSVKEASLKFHSQNLPPLKVAASCSEDKKPCPSEELLCRPLIFCAPFYKEVLRDNTFCKLESGTYGAICRNPTEGKRPPPVRTAYIRPPLNDGVSLPEAKISQVMSNAFDRLRRKDEMEMKLQSMGLVITDPRTSEYGHLRLFRTYPRAINRSRIAIVQEYAINNLVESLPASPTSITGIKSPIPCEANPTCGFQDFFYRRPDGSCNNLEHPLWGKSFAPMQRLTEVTYDDGISVPRKSVTGNPLPSARKVSAHTIHDADKPSQEFSLFLMQWGQFTDHDLALSPISLIQNSTGIQCCDPSGLHLQEDLKHPECLPIDIPEDDPFYSKFGQRCMNFVRSLPAPDVECRFSHRNQMDQLTHFLDGSMVYGSTKNQANVLRAFKKGLLKFNASKEFLPDDLTTNRYDFDAGDNRVNEQPLLTVMHTVWLRQHNRVARKLQRQKPQWNDETIYQETRKIIGAQIQHIVFNEWLPNVLGLETVEEYNLLPKREGFTNIYDATLNPSVINEFASAAFRFGHTLIQGTIRLFGKKHDQIKTIELSDNFDRPHIFTEDPLFDRLLRGLFSQPVQRFDNCIIDDLTTKLLKTEFSPFGMDLIALNTQRARDHGIGTYNDIREACRLPRATTFDDLHMFMRADAVPRFASLYESVEDIDPFVAGVSETSVRGGVLGAIFNCIIREQFTRLKFGDRFYYENGGMQNSFTEAQLEEIRKTSFARIVCDNSLGSVQKVQPLIFRLADQYNAKVPCSSKAIPEPNFSSWYGY